MPGVLMQMQEFFKLRSIKSRLRRSFDSEGEIGKQTLIQMLGLSPTIFEIGTAAGLDTQEFAVAFPAGRIFGFEAHPEVFTRAFIATKDFPNVQLIPAALSDRSGLATFNQSSGDSDGSGSILEPGLHLVKHERVYFRDEDKVVVPTIKLDDFVNETKIEQIDLIWIDVQGAELMVLKGAISSLAITKHVYCEVAVESGYVGGVNYEDLKFELAQHGFRPVIEFLPDKWGGEGNVLFSRLD